MNSIAFSIVDRWLCEQALVAEKSYRGENRGSAIDVPMGYFPFTERAVKLPKPRHVTPMLLACNWEVPLVPCFCDIEEEDPKAVDGKVRGIEAIQAVLELVFTLRRVTKNPPTVYRPRMQLQWLPPDVLTFDEFYEYYGSEACDHGHHTSPVTRDPEIGRFQASCIVVPVLIFRRGYYMCNSADGCGGVEDTYYRAICLDGLESEVEFHRFDRHVPVKLVDSKVNP